MRRHRPRDCPTVVATVLHRGAQEVYDGQTPKQRPEAAGGSPCVTPSAACYGRKLRNRRDCPVGTPVLAGTRVSGWKPGRGLVSGRGGDPAATGATETISGDNGSGSRGALTRSPVAVLADAWQGMQAMSAHSCPGSDVGHMDRMEHYEPQLSARAVTTGLGSSTWLGPNQANAERNDCQEKDGCSNVDQGDGSARLSCGRRKHGKEEAR